MTGDVSTSCAVCNGSGIVLIESEFPVFEVHIWCPGCETGRAKADRVAELIRRSLSGRAIRAA